MHPVTPGDVADFLAGPLSELHPVSQRLVEEWSVTGYRFEFETGETPAGVDPVAYEDLPAADRQAFLAGLGYGTARKLRASDDRPADIDGEFALAYPDREARESSVLVPPSGPSAARYASHTFTMRPAGTHEAPRRVYAVSLQQVADSTAAFAARTVARRGVRLGRTGLSPAAREVLEEAIDGGYTGSHPYEETETPEPGFAELLRALRLESADDATPVAGGPPVAPEALATFARYDGEWYRVSASQFVV